MGRPRKHNLHLPESMFLRRGAYYFVKGGKWIPLGREYGAALTQYAAFVGKPAVVRNVKDAVWSYIEHRRPKLAAATLAGYEHSAARLEARLGKLGLNDITPAIVYQYLSVGANVQANRDKALLSAAFTHARNTGAFSGVDPTKGLQYRNEEKPRQRYVTDDELAKVMEHASPKLACIVRFCYLTGMRQGDALALRLEHVTDDGIEYQTRKTGARIHIEWTPELKDCVDDAKRLWRNFGRVWLFESRPKGKHGARDVGPYTPSGLRALWRVARVKAGLPDVRLHDFRRKAGSDVEEAHAQALLGHADGKVTRRHYRAKANRVKPVK